MRTTLLLVAVTAAAVSSFVRHHPARDADASRTARTAPDSNTDVYRFTPTLRAGQQLDISNIDGAVTITQGGSGGAGIVVRKVVREGNGDLVKAVLEQTARGYRVCTVYLYDNTDRSGCEGDHGHRGSHQPLDVEMRYEVHLPAGVELAVHTVDSPVEAHGIDTPGSIRTVDGNVTFDGVAPDELNTVDGSVTATITNNRWDHDVSVRSVDGSVDVTLPAGIGLTVTGETVDGDIHADFPVTLAGQWGPRSFRATVGAGGSRELRIHTVDGSIHLHQRGS